MFLLFEKSKKGVNLRLASLKRFVTFESAPGIGGPKKAKILTKAIRFCQ